MQKTGRSTNSNSETSVLIDNHGAHARVADGFLELKHHGFLAGHQHDVLRIVRSAGSGHMVVTVTLILGGCRSGKSAFAQSLAEQHAGGHKVFVATSVPRDAEMQARVRRHQQDRGPAWQTAECPLNLVDSIRRHRPKADVLLIDCLTLWVANLLEEKAEEAFVFAAATLLEALEEAGCPIVLVGNEVGAGIVPENPLARLFRDVNGFVNQRVAARANRVVWMVAGLPVPVKTEP